MWLQSYDVARCEALIGGFFCICLYFFVFAIVAVFVFVICVYEVMIRQRADVAPGL